MTENCPSLVCMGCVSSLRGERHICGLHTGHGSDRELQFDVVRRHCARAMTYIGYPLPEDDQYKYVSNGLCQ